MSRLEAHAGFFSFLMKGIFNPYVQAFLDLGIWGFKNKAAEAKTA